MPDEPTDETTAREMNFGGPPFWQGDVYFTAIGETTGCSSYGVCDMGGNVEEWTDTFEPSNYRIARGGSAWSTETDLRNTGQDPSDPTTEGDLLGFRVAYIIPEPSTMALVFFGSLSCISGWICRKRY